MNSRVRTLLVGTTHVERHAVLWWGGLRAGIVVGGFVLLFVLGGQEFYALPAAVGALFVAVADAGESVGRRWRTMLWTTAWLMVATLLGGIGGNVVVLGILLTIPIAFLCGFVGAAGPRAALAGVLTLVMFIIFSGGPDSERLVLVSTLLVGLGGVVMTAVTVLPHLLERETRQLHIAPEASLRERLRGSWSLDNNFVRHGVRLAIVVTAATIASDITTYPHDYWLPMTIAWVTKPDVNGTATKIIARIAGTIVGVLITVLAVDLIGMSPEGIAFAVGVAALVAVAFLQANYAIAVAGITFIVIGLFTFDGDPVGSTIVLRIVLTILAGVLAFAGFFIWPPVRKHHRVDAIHAGP